MKIVVVGGTGLIGTKVVAQLSAAGHEAVAASRETGVNSYTTVGLEAALEGAAAVVDVSNSPYEDYEGALDFFATSTLNLLTYGAAAGVRHHVVLSVVGTDRLARAEGRYFQAKAEQERLVRQWPNEYTIVHSTQFFEFVRAIADSATDGRTVRLADAAIQPIAGDDTADAVVQAVLSAPTEVVHEVAGPERFRLRDLVAHELHHRADSREIAPDPLGRYFGATINDDDLLPSGSASIYPTRFADWLASGQDAASSTAR